MPRKPRSRTVSLMFTDRAGASDAPVPVLVRGEAPPPPPASEYPLTYGSDY